MATPVLINGSKGRMGRAIVGCASRRSDVEVVAEVDQGDSLVEAIARAAVVIDFSFHEATADVAELCRAQGKGLVIGTTGHSQEDKDRILAVTSSIPVVWASNFSTGVNTLFWLTRQAVRILGTSFDLEVVEMHHHHKKDAPSGTATTLAEILAEGRQVELEKEIRHGRQGIVGARTPSEIGMHSLRGGDVVGDHTVIFAADGERVELTHKASSRDTFANGALRAAAWLEGQAPGLYDMQDVLGLK